jgi:hypothetical protein
MSKDWIPEHDALNKAFDTGSIFSASRTELQQYLLTTCETDILSDKNKERNKRRADAIRHILQIRTTEGIATRSFWISIIAVIISLLSFASRF